MYTSFFGFKENPFSLTPDPNYLYLSRHHQAAYDHLLYGINERKGFIVITGGIGTGKTTLCRALLSALDEATKTSLVLNAYISDIELLRTINEEFNIDGTSTSETKKDYIDSLNRFLLDNHADGGNAVLLIDEAQNLSHTVLEQIRMLSNLETEKEKLVQIVLVGQLELRELLSSPSLKQLDERIMVRFDLKPLDRHDAQGYVEHRLVVAGGKGNVRFTKGAYGAIFAYSKGNPRRINAVCDRALLIAYSRDQSTITRKMIQKAVEDITGGVAVEHKPRRKVGWMQKRVAVMSALLVLLIVGAGIAGWQLRKELSAPLSDGPLIAEPPQAQPQAALERPVPKEVMPAPVELAAAQTEETMSLSVQYPAEPAGATVEPPPGPVDNSGLNEVEPVPEELALAVPEEVPPEPEEAEAEPASLFFDEQDSVGELFRDYYAGQRYGPSAQEEVHLGLYAIDAGPEHYVLFKKPFRVRVVVPPGESGAGIGNAHPAQGAPLHLIVREVTADGAVAVDVEGEERLVSREFLSSHWDREVCWIYPYEDDGIQLVEGVYGPEVIELQRRLNDAGYLIEITGIFDEPTFEKVVRLQADFGLQADGIVGQRTKGLLYQISD
jgi:general secretion pathway protein A